MSQQSRAAANPAAQDRPLVPVSVVNAVRLMYAGAAVTAAGIVISALALITGGIDALKSSYPRQSAAQLHHTLSTLVTVAVFSGVIEVAIWLVMARTNRGGLSWARIAACVLFALSTWNLVAHFLGPIQVVNLIYTALIWLVGAGAIVLLWRPDSSAYFATVTGQLRDQRSGAGPAGRSGLGTAGRSGLGTAGRSGAPAAGRSGTPAAGRSGSRQAGGTQARPASRPGTSQAGKSGTGQTSKSATGQASRPGTGQASRSASGQASRPGAAKKAGTAAAAKGEGSGPAQKAEPTQAQKGAAAGSKPKVADAAPSSEPKVVDAAPSSEPKVADAAPGPKPAPGPVPSANTPSRRNRGKGPTRGIEPR